MKKVFIIIPNAKLNSIDEKLEAIVKELKKIDVNFVLVSSNTNELKYKNANVILCDKKESTNNQIARAFKYTNMADCVLICDISQENYLDYINMLVSCWDKGAKIVRVQYHGENHKFFDKLKYFFKNVSIKIYQFFLKLIGLNRYCECYNLFQLFDKQVLDLLINLPEKNSYLRNYDALKNFNSVVVKTDEKLVFKKDKFVWNKEKTMISIISFLFLGILISGIYLMPLAKAKNSLFTFVLFYIILLIALFAFDIYCISLNIIKNKFDTEIEQKVELKSEQKAEAKAEEKVVKANKEEKEQIQKPKKSKIDKLLKESDNIKTSKPKKEEKPITESKEKKEKEIEVDKPKATRAKKPAQTTLKSPETKLEATKPAKAKSTTTKSAVKATAEKTASKTTVTKTKSSTKTTTSKASTAKSTNTSKTTKTSIKSTKVADKK